MNTELRLKDLKGLSPTEKVEFILTLSEGLRGEVEHHRHANAETEKVFDAFDLAMERTRLWLRGELSDAEALRYPAYNDDGTDIADTALTFREFLPESDIEIVGSTITTVALYAAFLQYRKDGVELLPHPYQGEMDDDELAWLFDTDLKNYSPALRAKFDALWEARFRPAAKPD